ncbi:MBOAT family protein [Microbulbifer bruguierae]|uniref:Probable alginate O-acetylase n=1 Tax=Microbulbifer bruguierae TaxID=3029061 RepID=A0ABY8NBS2_9GAMM|nr:MBOAT family O-acyltransferase [Microbulbifer bruguierae]WGL15242.1 MBOAT family protein [Microbulbifer bruguierae]
MLFNSIPFILVFLPAALIGFYALRRLDLFRISLAWLSVVSLFFYAWWNPKYLFLLLFSIIANFFLGNLIASSPHKRFFLITGIVGNLFAIAIYKYLGFFAVSVSYLTGTSISIPDLILPLAISFFTFQQIAYLVDTHRTGRAEKQFDKYLLFISFFPQLIAGPIVHHREVSQQFNQLAIGNVHVEKINAGIFLFVIGLAKKVLIADQLAPYATPVFSAADAGSYPSFLEAWGGLLAYSFQLYFDFSGYADMAVGLAKMFGVELPINFNSPYKSKNIIDFWRRWHITLSHFLRDYLYIPLGGSRSGSKNLNLLITMLLGGLWHGAGWNFVIWGGLHGAFLVINHQWLYVKSLISSFFLARFSGFSNSGGFSAPAPYLPYQSSDENIKQQSRTRFTLPSFIADTPGIITTFIAVSLAWIFFRSASLDGALSMLGGVSGLHGLVLPNQIFNIAPDIISEFAQTSPNMSIGAFPHISGFGVIFLAMLLAFFTPNSNQLSDWIFPAQENRDSSKYTAPLSLVVMVVTGVLFLVCVKIIAVSPDSEFLYFNF